METNAARAYLTAQAALVEHELERLLPSEPLALAPAMRYAVLGAGKRARPALVLAAAECCGAPAKLALPAACALELIHNYSLVHDDLPAMDNDDMRRGKPTVHRAFGEATALIAGDALLTLAFEVVSAGSLGAGVPAERIVALTAELAQAAGAAGMCGGQELELISTSEAAANAADTANAADADAALSLVRAISSRKTGALFRVALRLGAIAAGADAKALAALTSFGEAFGEAFQVVDDLLDVDQDGERPLLPTYLTALGVDGARARAALLAADACAAIAPFGSRADALHGILNLMLTRQE